MNDERGQWYNGPTGILGLIAVILIIVVAIVWLWINIDINEDPAAILALFG